MLTPASPRARASSATVPGRFVDHHPQLAQGTAAALRLEQPAPVLGRRRVPGGDRLAVARADQLGGLAEAGAERVDRLGDGLAVAGEDVAPDRRVGAGDPGRVAEARADLGQALGVAAELGVGLADEDVCDHVGKVADRRHHPVVGLGLDRLRAGAEAGDRALQAVVEDAAGAPGRGQVPAGAVEEVLAGVVDARGLDPGQRVAADEALSSPSAVTMPRLVEPTSVTTTSSPLAASASRASSTKRGDRGRADDHLGALAGLGHRCRRAVERADADRPLHRLGVRVEADDDGAVDARPRRAADRAADQADAEDRDPHRPRRALTASASPSRTETVSSQAMQASVIDCP